MNIKEYLFQSFSDLEINTVSDSFGGQGLNRRAPTFNFKPILNDFTNSIEQCDEPLRSNLRILKNKLPLTAFINTINCCFRFSFCIELTNLGITSTKMKTRWIPGYIIKTTPGTFVNYKGTFSPGDDQRAASFDDCYALFCRILELLTSSQEHIEVMSLLADKRRTGTPYENVFTYKDRYASAVHTPQNVELTRLEDIKWLAQARPIIRPTLNTKLISKIATKCYKTDRSQTGEVQTNRAKRWECLSIDFQYASIEECWSVERKLLSDIVSFNGYPDTSKKTLQASGLFSIQPTTVCPITFNPLSFAELLGGGAHGESQFQIGHMSPLKRGGVHRADNVQWISNDGNRIQGSLSVEETRQMLIGIVIRMRERGLIF